MSKAAGSPSTNSKLNSAVTHFVSIVTAVIASYFLFAGTKDTNEVIQLRDAYAQIQKQGEEIIELRQMLVDLQIQNIELRTKASIIQSRTELLDHFLDVLPFPMWIKQYEPSTGDFIMYKINQKYTARYGITANDYIGKTDFQVFPENLASSYLENDKIVMMSGKPIRTIELVRLSNGDLVNEIVYKFPIKLADGRMGVGGAAIKIPESVNIE